ncbi:MAG: SPOR domain-containing protein [Rhodobacteraceae bacterium]|nr:SPOR domain-containing protein [Paracoccaceae bacterium]
MKRFWTVAGVAALLSSGALAQVNATSPAELPPEEFEGREFVDSRGCVFLRSTFAGEVTWVPRVGADRQTVCDQTPTFAEAEADPEPDPSPEPVATGKEPAPTPTPAPRAATPRRPALPQADASGRHPSCPAKAPYGQLVDTALGRPLVRCVTSPSLFLPDYVDGPLATTAPRASTPAHGSGRMVQVGSFAVSANASRLQSRLQTMGLPVRSYPSRGLTVVSVGPFSSFGQAQSALSQMRGLGFSDAFLR